MSASESSDKILSFLRQEYVRGNFERFKRYISSPVKIITTHQKRGGGEEKEKSLKHRRQAVEYFLSRRFGGLACKQENYKNVTNLFMKVKLYNQLGEEAGKVDLPDAVFGLKWNADLVHQVVTAQEANRRPTVAHAKGRSEVRGGGRKPWRQKGTGRARHGSIRSPIWKGGGVTHGPLKEKSYKKKINKKMAKKALYTVLSAKARDNEVIILDALKFDEPKTKLAAKVFNNLKEVKKDITAKENRVLVLLPKMEVAVKRAIRNLPYAVLDEARNLNALQAMKHKYLLFTKDSVMVFK